MISLRSLKKSCRTSNPEGIAALFVCGLIGLAMVVMVPEKEISHSGFKAVDKVAGDDVSNSPPLEAVPGSESGTSRLAEVDLEKVVNFCITHTTASRGFVVFGNGTCALVREPSEDPVKEALALVNASAGAEARFLSERTAEGDLVVTFKSSVFHWIPGHDIEAMEKWSLENFVTLLSEKEREQAVPGWVPPESARLGLIARKRLLKDSKAPEVVRILRPNTAVAKIVR